MAYVRIKGLGSDRLGSDRLGSDPTQDPFSTEQIESRILERNLPPPAPRSPGIYSGTSGGTSTSKPRVAITDPGAGAAATGTKGVFTSYASGKTTAAPRSSVTNAVKGEPFTINWDAITGVVSTVAGTTKQILDQRAADRAARRGVQTGEPIPMESGIPWGKVAVGLGVGVGVILLVRKLLG